MAVRDTLDTTEHGIVSDDVYLEVMGCERHGRVRMIGKGAAPSDLWGKTSRSEYIRNATQDRQKLRQVEEKLSTVTQRNIDLKNKYTQLQAKLSFVKQILEILQSQYRQQSQSNGTHASLIHTT